MKNSGVDNRVGSIFATWQSGPPFISSEISPRSHNRDPEYCLLSEERNPFQRNPRQILVFCLTVPHLRSVVFGGPFYATDQKFINNELLIIIILISINVRVGHEASSGYSAIRKLPAIPVGCLPVACLRPVRPNIKTSGCLNEVAFALAVEPFLHADPVSLKLSSSDVCCL